jgi:ATP-dependent Clp protease ATP-binding subunit ClpC
VTRYAESAALALGIAQIEARTGRASEIEPGHLLLGLSRLCRTDLGAVLAGGELASDERGAVEADAERLRRRFALARVDPVALRRGLRGALTDAGPALEPGAVPHRNGAARRVFTRAAELAATEPAGAVELLRAILESSTPLCQEVFDRLGVADPLAAFFPEQREKRAAETPFLDRYGRDLTRLARGGKLPALIERRDELRNLARVLVKQRKANAVLVGDAAVGKTGIVEGLAELLAGPGAPADLAGARLIELSMSALVAGTKYRGEFEERVRAVVAEARDSPELILFIDELHTVLGAGGKGASDAANIFKPALARGELRCIGATTPGEYRRTIETDPALQRRFEAIRVDEPTRVQAVEILAGLRERELFHLLLHAGSSRRLPKVESTPDTGSSYALTRCQRCQALAYTSCTGSSASVRSPIIA